MAGTFVSNLLPEASERQRLARAVGAVDDLALLAAVGGDCAGALSLLPPETTPAAAALAARASVP